MAGRQAAFPEVSIVVPVFDKGRFLEETLRSVLGQTCLGWELILVEDGSSDRSLAIAEAHARRDPRRVRLVRHPGGAHRGPFASRILGARRARAGVIALLDADDVWEPDYLRRHLRFWRRMRPSGAALSYGPVVYWFPGVPAGTADRAHTMPARSEAVFQPGELLRNFLSSGHDAEPRTSGSLLARQALLAMAHFEPDARRAPTFEDNFMMWGIAARWPVAVHPHAWVRYRQRWRPGGRPPGLYRQLCRDEASFLRRMRADIARLHPRHPLLRPEGIPARLADLRRPGRASPFGDYFCERIPAALLRLADARS